MVALILLPGPPPPDLWYKDGMSNWGLPCATGGCATVREKRHSTHRGV
jgi:hypothetical protein